MSRRPRRGEVWLAAITSTAGHPRTHCAVGREAGVRKDSYVNCADIHTIRQEQLRQLFGRTPVETMREIKRTVLQVLGMARPTT